MTNAADDYDPFADLDDAPVARRINPLPAELRIARDLLAELDPFMACFSRDMKWKAEPAVWIMATNCIDTFYYNPENIEKLEFKAPLLACVIAHEIMHILRLDHEFMRGRIPHIANIALDAVVNRDLVRAGWKWPGFRFTDPLQPFNPNREPGLGGIATTNPQATALSVYNMLVSRRNDEVAKALEKNKNDLKDGVQKPDDATDKDAQERMRDVKDRARKAIADADVLSKAMEALKRKKAQEEAQAKADAAKQAQQDKPADKPQSEPQDASADSADYDPFADLDDDSESDPFADLDADNDSDSDNGDGDGDESDAGEEGEEGEEGEPGDENGDDADGNGAGAGDETGEEGEGDASGSSPGDGAASSIDVMDTIGQGMEGALGGGEGEQGEGWSIGDSAAIGALEKLGLFVSPPVIRLQRALASRVQGVMKGWAKRSRSYQTPNSLSRKFNRIIPGARQTRIYEIAIAIDCSGSISPEDLQLFSSLAHAWSTKFARQANIHMCFFNDRIVREGTADFFQNEDNIPAPGGGTNFIPVFGKWIEELPRRPTHVLHFSDLYGAWPEEPQGVHVVHLVPPQYRSQTAPFGDILIIEE